MRTSLLLIAATLIASPVAVRAQDQQVAPPEPAAPVAPEPPRVTIDIERRGEQRRVLGEARETREADREIRQAARELSEKVRNRVALVHQMPVPPVPPMPPIPALGPGFPAGAMLLDMSVKDQDKQLSPDDARRIVDGVLAFRGNKRLKVGKAEADGDSHAVVEIVTLENSLVDTVRVNRKTGALDKVL